MATFNLRAFSRPELLRTIAPARLIALLEPYRTFLTARTFALPSAGDGAQIDYDRLTGIFMTPDAPDAKTPQPLIDTLYVLDEMATAEGMDALVAGATKAGVTLSHAADQTPIDVCVEAWLADSDFVQSKHAEQYLEHLKSFEYYPPSGDTVPDFKLPKTAVLRTLESRLDDWFEKHKRGRGARVYMFPREQHVWFLIRHGQPLRREGSLEDGKPSSVLYRPEKFDIVIYDQSLAELRINAGTKGERELYRASFGAVLFKDEDFFAIADKFTLDPLRVDGEDSLKCDDIDGIEWIKLKEIQFRWGGAQGEIEIRKAKDVFAAYTARKASMPARPKIIKARFEVKFDGSKKTRKVAVHANGTQCLRNEDSLLIDQWLKLRRFIVAGSWQSAQPNSSPSPG